MMIALVFFQYLLEDLPGLVTLVGYAVAVLNFLGFYLDRRRH